MKFCDKENPKIIAVDRQFLVVYKPAGLLTQKEGEERDCLEDFAKEWLKKECEKEKVFLHCVHRLDKPVSGLVLFARTSKSLSRLNEQMRERKIVRLYQALVEGLWKEEKEKDLKHYLLHGSHKALVVSATTEGAKLATLSCRFIKKIGKNTLVEISLQTGRYHQIRAQLGAIGHPIVGDKKYGSQSDLQAICLHQGHLEFFHPITQERLVFDISANFSAI